MENLRNRPIGVLDSGWGGLTVWKEIRAYLPKESTLYLADHAYLPYSDKSTTVIRKRIRKLVTFLLLQHAKLVVIACNAATVSGIDSIRQWFPTLPIIGVVPVVKTAAERSIMRAFAVLSTPKTTRSRYQQSLIRSFAPGYRVYQVSSRHLVPLVERGVVSGKRVRAILLPILLPLKQRIDVLVLGCTHYPFLTREIRAIVGNTIAVLDSAGAVARHTERILSTNGILATNSRPSHSFYTTGRPNETQPVASKLLHKKIRVTYGDI